MIIIKYILSNHLAPFLFSIFTLISVFLLQFLMKFADRLVGKGLSLLVILQLIIYNLAWMVVLVVPMAVLVATLMAFGSMSQNNEVAILKASGVSLYKMMIPPLVASVIVAAFLVHFNNNIYPDANHKARILMEDISRKRPTLSIVPGVFSQEIPNYSILVRDIDQSNNLLKNLTIYDYSSPPQINVVTAETGKIYFSKDQKKMIMDLTNGEIHETDNTKSSEYRKLRFSRHKIAMPADQFTFEQSSPGGPRGDRELGAYEILKLVDSLNVFRERYYSDFTNRITAIVKGSEHKTRSLNETTAFKQYVFIRTKQRIEADRNSILSIISRVNYNKQEINRYWVEIHKKYALPFACIVFVLIGAPLGTMTRKGGFGMAAGISLVFFLIYWTFLISGEKLADRGMISPFIGMWSANIVLSALGILLMIKSAKEKVTLNFEFITKYIPQSWKAPEETNEDS